MAKQIVVLSAERTPGALNIQYVMWLPVPSASQAVFAKPGFVSAFTGATIGELTALRAGSGVEVVEALGVTSISSVAQIKAALTGRYAVLSSAFTATLNLPEVYGIFWDGST